MKSFVGPTRVGSREKGWTGGGGRGIWPVWD